ncbi:MAG: GGDEF domain-containing protein [Firmicutes bacterium]|nr:GGDEF domain-containing protein [Bacillota bacterium]
MGNKEYVEGMAASFLETLNKKAIFLKQQDLNVADIKEIYEGLPEKETVKIFFFEYALYDMKEAYGPFMQWIRQAYESEYADTYSVEEFVENCGVYSLQREVFCSYITDGLCKRKLEVLMNEYDYENERMMESVYSALKYIGGDKKLVCVIGRLHMAPVCVLRFLNRIFEREDSIRFIFTHGESFLVKGYCQDEWRTLLQKAGEGKMILVTENKERIHTMDVPDKFNYREDQIGSYIKALENMVHLQAFEDARYYFDSIIPLMDRIDAKVRDEDKFKMLELLGMAHLGMGDAKDAMLVCEKMVPLFYNSSDIYREYIYYYFSAKAHLLMEEPDLAHKFCASCRSLAEKMQNELLIMNADIVDIMAETGGWKELFRCNFSYQIGEDVLARVKKVGNENFLAYIYVFGYDNDEESVRQIGRGQKEPVYFNMGIAIAERLGNKNLLLNAYMKNIILYSDYGCYRYVRQMYEKRIEIIEKDKPLRIAHTYVGLGYNEIILEDYARADEYFRKGLTVLIEHKRAEDVAEALYNMFLNYYVAGSNRKAIDCMELLLKVMKTIHVQSLRICNTSKMYGLLALAYYKLGQYLDCFYCVDQMELIMSYVLNKDDESEKELWIEDLFLYHLCKANIFHTENRSEKAREHFEKAYRYMKKAEGAKFYSYAEYAFFYGRFLQEEGLENERRNALLEAYEYYMEHDFPLKASRMKSEMDAEPDDGDVSYKVDDLPEKEILDVCQYVGSGIELEKRKKDIDFMMLCHNFMGREGNTVSDVVKQTMNLIRNTFSFDRILFIENKPEQPDFTFVSENIELDLEEISQIIAFFQDYKVEFMAGRLDKSFQRYLAITRKIGGDEIATIMGIPMYNGGTLTRIFIAATDVHRSFTENRKIPDYNDLEVIKFAISQLDEEIARIYSSHVIHIMNEKLEKAAYTDQLTGIYNRMGLKRLLDHKLIDTGVLLYMDLDYFKKYNDTYGHSIGDSILKVFADIISENMQEYGYAIRYGGDEFLSVIPNKDEAFGEKIAENIQTRLREDAPGKIEVEGLKLTSSVGIAMYENAACDDLEGALSMADKALYYVKNNKKGGIARWSQVKDFI